MKVNKPHQKISRSHSDFDNARLNPPTRSRSASPLTTSNDELIYHIMKSEGKVVYEGYTKDGLPHGTGTRFFPNGNYYYGEWKSGLFNGIGNYIGQETYNGLWVLGKLYNGKKTDGKGTIENINIHKGPTIKVFPNGSTLTANYYNDMEKNFPLGPAEFKFLNGDAITGIIIGDAFHGSGKLIYKESPPGNHHGIKVPEGTFFTAYFNNYKLPVSDDRMKPLEYFRGSSTSYNCIKGNFSA